MICRFGLSRIIIIDNGRQLENLKFKKYCSKFYIDNRLISVGHPQSNGETEVTNRTILHDLKTRLTDTKDLWAKKMQSILWIYRTTHQISIGKTPFSLTYGTEAMIPVEIDLLSDRVRNFYQTINFEWLRTNLNLLDEIREQAHIGIAIYKRYTRFITF